ncbi:NUDIX hydrolase N-terminal domain-containing protein [Aquimarina sp. 2201CG5-10]|uniref:NUDIX hydrolase N-terminal domain-containing protein n=1 Tax=Aquimarina callyspongiae TaxID=3098150 RepID=UPI002AB3F796|nr:NUDIX hydrolase N-terminal domain-containing protein [Aquimarina sp. 2201CG5-10]MDY8134464.1 NUDIX hydrolase N-terminal domain-containing protein [Aquimarina sp. 2201CG5-10]
MEKRNSLELIKRIKSLSETGLVYCQDEYDKERYDELLEISLELLSIVSEKPIAALNDFFMPSHDYPTPKVDIRAFCFNKSNEILLVKEKLDGKWSLPGGWGDIGFSPSEVIVKEVKEETGLDAKVIRLLAIYDKKHHPHPPQPFYVYKLVFLCELFEGEINTSFDIEKADYFNIDHLPELSENRILKSQILQLHNMVINQNTEVYFD